MGNRLQSFQQLLKCLDSSPFFLMGRPHAFKIIIQDSGNRLWTIDLATLTVTALGPETQGEYSGMSHRPDYWNARGGI